MARECAICGKGNQVGHTRKLLRGHYNVTSIRRFKPNLQKVAHEGRKVLACQPCIRTKVKAAK
ncbi:MAG: L28 family ribosomal protein [Candidatus Andersenbacteria bacterium]